MRDPVFSVMQAQVVLLLDMEEICLHVAGVMSFSLSVLICKHNE